MEPPSAQTERSSGSRQPTPASRPTQFPPRHSLRCHRLFEVNYARHRAACPLTAIVQVLVLLQDASAIVSVHVVIGVQVMILVHVPEMEMVSPHPLDRMAICAGVPEFGFLRHQSTSLRLD